MGGAWPAALGPAWVRLRASALYRGNLEKSHTGSSLPEIWGERGLAGSSSISVMCQTRSACCQNRALFKLQGRKSELKQNKNGSGA